MCGITGFVENRKEKEMILSKMMQRIVHRGPDSAGSYVDEAIAMGFRRLSIIDLETSGDQPLYNEEKTLVLTFNGEIYNYQELRLELIKKGHDFVSHTDSEVLIHGYEEWGENLVYKLRGMFAFVIWDRKKQRLYGARDHFGIKPFYYYHTKDLFLYGSEIKSFLEHPGFKKEVNEDVLPLYLSYQFVPTNETLFKNVFCLQPGYYFLYEKNTLVLTRYFDPRFSSNEDQSHEEIVEDIKDVMEDSIEHHMISDVEVGSYLSSGIDSSYLSAKSHVHHAFTVGFGEGSYSEIEEAKEFAELQDFDHHTHVITKEEYLSHLQEALYYMDEPVADPAAIALFFLSKEAQKKVKVVLSGEGSDELFGGYNIYSEPSMHRSFNRLPMGLRRTMGHLASHLPQGTKGRGFLMRHGQTLQERYYSNATNVFTPEGARCILRHPSQKYKVTDLTKDLYNKMKDQDEIAQMQYVDMHLWLVHDILMKSDKMGMAHSIEVRVPFLDKKVFDLASHLPTRAKLDGAKTKVALRQAARQEIPEKTASKKKLGFPIPIRVWLKEEDCYEQVKAMFSSPIAQRFFHKEQLIKMLEDHKNNVIKNIRTDHSRRIWSVYVFLLWYERFFVLENQKGVSQ